MQINWHDSRGAWGDSSRKTSSVTVPTAFEFFTACLHDEDGHSAEQHQSGNTRTCPESFSLDVARRAIRDMFDCGMGESPPNLPLIRFPRSNNRGQNELSALADAEFCAPPGSGHRLAGDTYYRTADLFSGCVPCRSVYGRPRAQLDDE
jgi:hypothetical protein